MWPEPADTAATWGCDTVKLTHVWAWLQPISTSQASEKRRQEYLDHTLLVTDMYFFFRRLLNKRGFEESSNILILPDQTEKNSISFLWFCAERSCHEQKTNTNREGSNLLTMKNKEKHFFFLFIHFFFWPLRSLSFNVSEKKRLPAVPAAQSWLSGVTSKKQSLGEQILI